jgi:hypothetical protein
MDVGWVRFLGLTARYTLTDVINNELGLIKQGTLEEAEIKYM